MTITAKQLRSTANRLADACDYLNRQALKHQQAGGDQNTVEQMLGVFGQIQDRMKQLHYWAYDVDQGDVSAERLADMEAGAAEFLALAAPVLERAGR